MKTWTREDVPSFGDFNGDYVAYMEEHGGSPGTQFTRVYDANGHQVLQHSPDAAAWYTQEVWLTKHFAVIEDINEAQRLVRLAIYDLTTGERLELPDGAQPTQPEVDASFGQLTFVTGDIETQMCQRLVDLEAGAAMEIFCAERGEILGDSATGDDGISFSRLRDVNTESRCKDVFTWRKRQLEKLPLRQACIGWSGDMIDGAVAWDEMNPEKQSLGNAKGFARAEGGSVLPLKRIDTDSLVGCGSMFFWEAEDGRGPRVDAWSEDGGIQTAWEPNENLLPTRPECSDGRWLNMRVDDIGGQNERLKFVVLDAENPHVG